ncbi:hemagglutinin repeat-containing protein, partial [Janthinobacterium sp. LB2P49]|uniref:hemagglutinin repeat-containing protein n=1 Tax=Janthinobacterium sp. LB2P49 TaxID=3424198 RepID=UPI003F253535
NTHVNAGDKLVITSGGDTNIKGAVASANQVIADIKGNLNLESLQDTAKFDSKSQSISVSGTVGFGASVSGSYSQSNMHNDYASVQEQSGIKAGDGGFQIKVGGNTDLKGAVISATEAGKLDSSLITSTLTHSDIANHAISKGSSVGVSGGMSFAGTGPKNDNLTNVGGEKDAKTAGLPIIVGTSENASSTTRSGISGGTLVITDDAAQRAATGKGADEAIAGINRDVTTGVDSSGKIGNNFDKAALQATMEVAKEFVKAAAPLAAGVVGSIGKSKQDAADVASSMYEESAKAARSSGDAEKASYYDALAKQAKDTAESWGDNGFNRIALHAAAQGLIGGLSSGAGGALSGVGGVVGGNWGQQLGHSLGEAEANKQDLKGEERKEFINTYQQTLASIGGALGGVVASGASGQGGSDLLSGMAQGGITATTVDVYNRQLHDNEKARIKQLAGNDAAKEARLTAAACAAVKCYAEYPVDSDIYKKLKQLADIGDSPSLSSERQLLAKQTGQFQYTTDGFLSNKNSDAVKQINNTYQISTRTFGAGQMVLGGIGVAGSVVTAPASCVTGVGCAANWFVGTVSLDAAYAGSKQLISGKSESTFMNQGLQGLGMSPQAANLVEMALGVGSAATALKVANRSIDQAIALRKLTAESGNSGNFKNLNELSGGGPLERTITVSGKSPNVVSSQSSQPLLLEYTPTTKTLSEIRNMRGPDRWKSAEDYIQELTGSSGQQHFQVPATTVNGQTITGSGGRFVDAPVPTSAGGIQANEVKMYQSWRTVNGEATQQTVPLSDNIQQQILKDVWLRANTQGYEPRWIFLDAGPSLELSKELAKQKIIQVIHH